MSKKASGDQFSLSGGNSDSVEARKTVFAAGRTFFGWLFIYVYIYASRKSIIFEIAQKYIYASRDF